MYPIIKPNFFDVTLSLFTCELNFIGKYRNQKVLKNELSF